MKPQLLHDNMNWKGIQKPLPVFEKKIKEHHEELRIAFMSQEFSKNCNGGVCRYTYDLAHTLAESGNKVHVITKSKQKRDYIDNHVFVHEISPENINFLDIPKSFNVSKKNLSYSYTAALKILELIEKFGIQIVEAPLWDAEGFVFSLVKSIPLVIRLETPLFKVTEIQQWPVTKDLRFANWMEGETLKGADRAIAISENIGQLIRDHHKVSEQLIEPGPLGIEIPDTIGIGSETKEHGLNVLFVGRLETRKGVETLFKAIPVVLEHVDAHFSIVGNDTDMAPTGGSYKKYLLGMLEEKYHTKVDFIGYVDDADLKNYYKNCDLFVAPSLYESFGLIFLEAMAWEKPVIGCNVGGIPEIVDDGMNGILVQPDDEKALARAIITLLDDKEMRITMGKSGRQKVEKEFSTKKMAKTTESIYREILASYMPRNE